MNPEHSATDTELGVRVREVSREGNGTQYVVERQKEDGWEKLADAQVIYRGGVEFQLWILLQGNNSLYVSDLRRNSCLFVLHALIDDNRLQMGSYGT